MRPARTMSLLPTTFTLRRLVRQRMVTVSLVIGITLAVALGVVVPLAVNALSALGLRTTIAAMPPLGHNIQLIRTGEPFNLAFENRVSNQLGDLVGESYTVGYSPILGAEAEQASGAYPVILRYQERLEEHSVLSGPAPEPRSRAAFRRERLNCSTFEPIQALLSEHQLELSGLRVGNRLCVGGMIPLTISASFHARDRQERYWQGDLRPEVGTVVSGGLGAGDPIFVLMLAREDFAEIANFFDPTRHVYLYRAAMRTELINLDTVATVDERLREFRTQLNSTHPRPLLITGIDRVISTFNTRLQLLQSALVPLVLSVITLALVYVVLVGALATEQQNAETAVLRSRGASQLQVFGSQVNQALIVAVPGLVAGAVAGAVLYWLLARTELFRLLGSEQVLPWRLTANDARLAGLILLVAVAGLLLAGRPALRQSSVTLRQEMARPPRRPSLRQLQGDVLVGLLALLGWWQLRRYGGSLTASFDGTPRFNLLVLSAPILMLLGGSLLFLRLFPFAVRGLGLLLSRRPGIVVALSAWQLARNPRPYGRLVLLLTLTVGLGAYAQTTSRTIAREQLHQALDTAGADVRIPLTSESDAPALLAGLPATAHAFLTRLDGSVFEQTGSMQEQQGTVTLLGVDGGALSTVLAQSGSTDQALLATLRTVGAGTAPPLGIQIPPGATALRVAVKGAAENVLISAKVVGLDGAREIELGRPGEDWQTLEARLPQDLQAPLAVQALIAQPESQGGGRSPQGISFDDMEALVGSQAVMLDDFDDPQRWDHAAPRSGQTTLVLETRARPGRGYGVRLGFGSLPPGSWATVFFRTDATLPVYAMAYPGSTPARTGSTLRVGVGTRQFNVAVQGQIERLPGLAEERRTLFVTHRGRLAAVATYGLPVGIPATELRVALRPGAEFTAPQDAETKAAALLAKLADPLSNGVRLILQLGFACAALLSVVGFLTHAALSLRAREVDLAVLRAIGLSPRQLLLLVAAEQGFLLGGGLVAGILVGLLLNVATRPFLQLVAGDLSTAGAAIDWPGLALLAGSLLLALTLALGLLLGAVRRRGMFRALRLGEA